MTTADLDNIIIGKMVQFHNFNKPSHQRCNKAGMSKMIGNDVDMNMRFKNLRHDVVTELNERFKEAKLELSQA